MVTKLKFLKKLEGKTKVGLGMGALIIKNYRPRMLPSRKFSKSSRIEEQEVLLELRADCGLWSCPGGGLIPGENIEECVKREVKEETNIDITVDNLFSVYSDPKIGSVRHYLEDDSPQKMIDIFVIGLPTSHKIIKSEESLDVKYFKFKDIPDNLVPTASRAIKDYRSIYRLNKKAILR